MICHSSLNLLINKYIQIGREVLSTTTINSYSLQTFSPTFVAQTLLKSPKDIFRKEYQLIIHYNDISLELYTIDTFVEKALEQIENQYKR